MAFGWGALELANTNYSCGHYCTDLTQSGRQQQPAAGSHGRDCDSLFVSAEATRHSPNRLGNNSDRDDLQPMQKAGRYHISPCRGAKGEQDKDEGRRQGEACPRCQGACEATAGQPDSDANLTAGRTGQKLAQADQIGEAALGNPASA